MQEWRPESSESRNTVLNRFWGAGGFRSDLRKGSALLATVVRKMKNQGEKRPLPLSEVKSLSGSQSCRAAKVSLLRQAESKKKP